MSSAFTLLTAGRKAFEKPCDILLLSFIPVAGCPKDMHAAQQYFLPATFFKAFSLTEMAVTGGAGC